MNMLFSVSVPFEENKLKMSHVVYFEVLLFGMFDFPWSELEPQGSVFFLVCLPLCLSSSSSFLLQAEMKCSIEREREREREKEREGEREFERKKERKNGGGEIKRERGREAESQGRTPPDFGGEHNRRFSTAMSAIWLEIPMSPVTQLFSNLNRLQYSTSTTINH